MRAFSHGCIRLNEPFEFAYALLARQEPTTRGRFSGILTGARHRVNLDEPVPVHLIYRTAFTRRQGARQYPPDVYGRDARIWARCRRRGGAARAGVKLSPRSVPPGRGDAMGGDMRYTIAAIAEALGAAAGDGWR